MGDWLSTNNPCSDCGSSDGKQESQHHWKCFACGNVTLKRGTREPQTANEVSMSKEGLINNEFYAIKSRGITKDTATRYKIGAAKYSGVFGRGDNKEYVKDEWAYVFNRANGTETVSQKIRIFSDKKKMKVVGETTKNLYGSWLFEPKATNFCVLSEGEFDCAVVNQETGIAAVSVNTGCAGALGDIKNNIDWLQKWQYVVLCFDNDEPGQKAVQKILDENVFDPGKVRVAHLTGKDANDMLLSGKSAELKKAIWNASSYSPPDIILPADCMDEVLVKPVEGMRMPWPSMQAALLGWRENTITTIGASDGIGKSEAVDEIIHTLIYSEKEKVFLFSAEQEAAETIQRQAGKILNLPLHVPGVPFDESQIVDAIKKLEDRLVIWKPDRAVKVEDFIAKMHYASVAYGCKMFILDHLKALESQFNDSNKEMGRLLSDLKTFAKSHKASILLISHVRKPSTEGDSFNKGRPPTKEDFYGSSALTAWSNTIIALSRNVESDDAYEASVMRVDILKNRLMGNRGINKFYNQYFNDTGRLLETAPPDYAGDDNG